MCCSDLLQNLYSGFRDSFSMESLDKNYICLDEGIICNLCEVQCDEESVFGRVHGILHEDHGTSGIEKHSQLAVIYHHRVSAFIEIVKDSKKHRVNAFDTPQRNFVSMSPMKVRFLVSQLPEY